MLTTYLFLNQRGSLQEIMALLINHDANPEITNNQDDNAYGYADDFDPDNTHEIANMILALYEDKQGSIDYRQG